MSALLGFIPRALTVALSVIAVSAPIAIAQTPPSETAAVAESALIETTGDIVSVTVHPDRAAVVRRATVHLSTGRFSIRFINLPRQVDPASLRARLIRGGTIERLSFESFVNAEALASALRSVDESQIPWRQQRESLESRGRVLDKQEALFDALSDRTSFRTAAQTGTGGVNLAEVTRVAEFLAQNHADLLARRTEIDREIEKVDAEMAKLEELRARLLAAGAPIERAAVVLVTIAPELGAEAAEADYDIELAYLASGAAWSPAFNLRADPDAGRTMIELDAHVRQDTGEDWHDVDLTLSTAAAGLPTQPPTLQPWYIDLASGATAAGSATSNSGAASREALLSTAVFGTGSSSATAPATTYHVPRPSTIPSSADSPQRLRIVTSSSPTRFEYVAAPLLADHAYLRGTLSNTSGMLLPGGSASVFMSSAFSGPADLALTRPGESFEVFFGVDRRVRVQRLVRNKRIRATGLLGDGRETIIDYRLTISNESGSALSVELWDRMPVSRTDQIRISLTGLSESLSSDDTYRDRDRPLGLLRWDVDVAADQRGQRELRVDYTVVVSHHRDVTPSMIPD